MITKSVDAMPAHDPKRSLRAVRSPYDEPDATEHHNRGDEHPHDDGQLTSLRPQCRHRELHHVGRRVRHRCLGRCSPGDRSDSPVRSTETV